MSYLIGSNYRRVYILSVNLIASGSGLGFNTASSIIVALRRFIYLMKGVDYETIVVWDFPRAGFGHRKRR